jgi:hypothetical protein
MRHHATIDKAVFTLEIKSNMSERRGQCGCSTPRGGVAFGTQRFPCGVMFLASFATGQGI